MIDIWLYQKKMVRVPIKRFLDDSKRVLVLDGGQGTEMENRGIKVANPVWSSIPFMNESFWSEKSSDERKIVEKMYNDFMSSGSNVLMTITYQASFTAVTENSKFKTLAEYNFLLDRIVNFTRKMIGGERYLVGSVGPWAAYNASEYTGDYGPHAKSIDYYGYHKPQLDNFNNSQEIDMIGFETVPNFHELKAILSWDKGKISKPFYVSLTTHDGGSLRDGTPIEVIAEHIKNLGDKINSNFLLLGINCVSFNVSDDILKLLHNALPDMPLLVYPNSGEIYDSEEKIWLTNKSKSKSWGSVVESCIGDGARVIGGCCRTTPQDIADVAAAVRRFNERAD